MSSPTSAPRPTDDTPSALPPGVRIVTLDNGLTVITREDHSAPVVSAQAWAMTGSIHEDRWLGAGLSHVLEHMLFKGTSTRPGSRIDQEVQEAGGIMNAYTSFDRTVYHIDVPNTGVQTAVSILCDIMQNASLPPETLAKELDVIRREMDMGQDDPARRSGRRLFETAYTKSPYRYTVIGYPDIFNELKPEDIRNYYRERYAPNNIFYVITGDFQHEAVVAQIRAAYAQTKFHVLPAAVLPTEPRQTAPREVIEEAPIELGYLHLAWHIPEVRHPDVPLLDVLAAVLGSGRSSRFYQEVREKQGLVHFAEAWTYNPGNPGLFGVSAMVDGDKFSAARNALLAEIEKVKHHCVPDPELRKAKKQFISATLAARKTMQGQAQDLGNNWLAANDLNFSQHYLAAVQQAAPADLQRVAREYLRAENRTLYALLPEGATPTPAVVHELDSVHEIEKFTLPNGLRLLVKEDHRLPFVEFRAVFQGGVLAEQETNNGITQLMARLLVKGTTTRSAEQIASEIESLGGSLDSYSGNNSFGINAEILHPDFEVGLRLLADVIRNPTFPAAPLEREREVQIAGIRSHRDDLLKSAFQSMRRELFGPTRYGLDSLGTEAALNALDSAQVRHFYQQLARPSNCVIAIYGDIKASAAHAAVAGEFGEWAAAPATPRTPAAAQPTPAAAGLRRLTEFREKKQAVVVVGFPGSTLTAADREALDVLQETCSDLGSRLFLRIRENLGLAYYVGAQNFVGLIPGYFAFYAGTEPAQAALVETEIFKEIELLRAAGITAEELKRAKAKLIGQRKIARQELGGFASTTALDELYGLGYGNTYLEDEKVEAVTLDQVQAAAQKYLRPDLAVVALINPAPTPR
ncbi:MAG TPA: pitrilysin family protein [Verrucomicrobiota bacterium]|nr:pitrilysin family protein [Verrucomicrobiota bacterium]HNT15151.1 pitrilysin family protein [Verrucomicrobiota bacterium]